MKKKQNFLDYLTYIFLIAIVFFSVIPMAWVISTSFKPSTEIFANPPTWIPNEPTLQNYIDIFLESSIPTAFLNSMVTGTLTALLSLILGGSMAYALARFRFRGSSFLSVFVLSSQMLPITVLMIPIYYMENKVGLVDTKIGVALAHLTITLPLVTWMAKGYFSGIPKEIEEAAIIDGCNTFQVMTKIIIPLLKPALAATGIYAFISSWNEYALANVLTRSTESMTVPIALSGFSSYYKVDWGDTMAAAAVISIPIVIIFMMIQKQFVEGIASGAVKG